MSVVLSHEPWTLSLAADADTIFSLSAGQLTLDPQTANTVLAGPTGGGPADPTFRALVSADLPSHSHSHPFVGADHTGDTDYTSTPNVLGIGVSTGDVNLFSDAGITRTGQWDGASGFLRIGSVVDTALAALTIAGIGGGELPTGMAGALYTNVVITPTTGGYAQGHTFTVHSNHTDNIAGVWGATLDVSYEGSGTATAIDGLRIRLATVSALGTGAVTNAAYIRLWGVNHWAEAVPSNVRGITVSDIGASGVVSNIVLDIEAQTGTTALGIRSAPASRFLSNVTVGGDVAGAASSLSLVNDFDLVMYTDAGSTQVFQVDGDTGHVLLGAVAPSATNPFLIQRALNTTSSVNFNQIGTSSVLTRPSAGAGNATGYAASFIVALAAAGSYGGAVRGFQSGPTVRNDAGDVVTLAEFSGFVASGTVNGQGSSLTVTDYRGLWILNPSVVNSGAITTAVGVRINALTSGATNIGIQNLSTSRLVDAVTIGADAAASSGLILDITGTTGLKAESVLRFYGSATDYIGLRAPTTPQADNWLLTLPSDDPAVDEVMAIASAATPNASFEFRTLYASHIVTFHPITEDMAAGALWPTTGICVGESGEHGTFTAIRAKAVAGTAGGGTNTIVIEADTDPSFPTAVTLFTIALDAATEADDTTLDNAWDAGDIFVRARCTALGSPAPKEVTVEFFFKEKVVQF